MTHRRWLVVALLFAMTFTAYMDRVNFAVATPQIEHDYGFTLRQIGTINFAWALVYALFNYPGGWIADRLRLRWGMAAAIAWWSVFTIASPFAGGLGGWVALRALMGAGEAPIWSYTAKATDDWMAPDERSTAYGLAGSGEFLGPALGAVATGLIATHLGWRWSFVLFGAAGFVLAPAWIAFVRDTPEGDPRVGDAERARIGAKPAAAAPDWAGIRAVIASRTGAGILITYLANGYVLFTFKNWLPSYMHDTFGVSTLSGSLWTGISSGLGFVGFVLAGPINDGLVRRMDRLTARRLGTAIPGVLAIACLTGSVVTARAHFPGATALLIGGAQLLSTITAGAWAVSVIDLSPSRASTGVLYGWFNGALNLMGAVNALAIAWLATAFGYPVAFGSAVVMLALFILGMVVVVDRASYTRLLETAEGSRRGRG